MALQTGTGGQAELVLDVIGGEKQDTMGILPVPPGPPGFLQIVFQRTGNVGMNDKTDIGLVYPHAKRIGRRDHP